MSSPTMRLRLVAQLSLAILLTPAWLQLHGARAAPTPSGDTGDARAAAILGCFKSTDCTKQPTDWSTFLEDRPCCVQAARVWWSRAPSPPSFPVTLVTQLSVDRLQQVRAQCATWGGPLAAAVYLPLLMPGAKKGGGAAGGAKAQRPERQRLRALLGHGGHGASAGPAQQGPAAGWLGHGISSGDTSISASRRALLPGRRSLQSSAGGRAALPPDLPASLLGLGPTASKQLAKALQDLEALFQLAEQRAARPAASRDGDGDGADAADIVTAGSVSGDPGKRGCTHSARGWGVAAVCRGHMNMWVRASCTCCHLGGSKELLFVALAAACSATPTQGARPITPPVPPGVAAALQGGGGCQLRLLLVVELFSDPQAATLYPVNTLRNVARLMADTPLAAAIDVDMLPSATLTQVGTQLRCMVR